MPSDDHEGIRPVPCLISATNRRPSTSTTSQENRPRNCVVPSAWAARRASISERKFDRRRPSLVTSVHIAIAVDHHCWVLLIAELYGLVQLTAFAVSAPSRLGADLSSRSKEPCVAEGPASDHQSVRLLRVRRGPQEARNRGGHDTRRPIGSRSTLGLQVWLPRPARSSEAGTQRPEKRHRPR